jgi:hypothetical protein
MLNMLSGAGGGFKPPPMPDLTDKGVLGRIACQDPRLAYALATPIVRPDLIGGNLAQCGQWGLEIIPVTVTWEAGTADQFLRGRQNGIVETDLWIRYIYTTVERPNAFAGSLFKSQSDYFNAQQPNVDVTLDIKSYCRYQIAISPFPLQLLSGAFECACPIGLVLGCAAQIEATFQNRRALAADEVPMRATVALWGIRLPTRYDSCNVDFAVKALIEAGILPARTP